jgi:MFS family permease
MMSYVALPYVLYQSTKSTFLTGLLGIIQLVPSIIGGLFGGVLADSMNRRRLILICEIGMASVVLALGLAITFMKPLYPHPAWIVVASFLISMFNGFHRPTLEALTPMIIKKEEIPAVGVLSSFRGSMCMILGPAVSGILIAAGGADFASTSRATTIQKIR